MKKKEIEIEEREREKEGSKRIDLLFNKDGFNVKYGKLGEDNKKVGCLSIYSPNCCIL